MIQLGQGREATVQGGQTSFATLRDTGKPLCCIWKGIT